MMLKRATGIMMNSPLVLDTQYIFTSSCIYWTNEYSCLMMPIIKHQQADSDI